MTVIELLNKNKDERHFSFEVLPPLKGTGTDKLFATIEKMKEFNPLFINITTHHSEFVYKQLDNGLLQRNRVRRRPGTIAIAAAIAAFIPSIFYDRYAKHHEVLTYTVVRLF